MERRKNVATKDRTQTILPSHNNKNDLDDKRKVLRHPRTQSVRTTTANWRCQDWIHALYRSLVGLVLLVGKRDNRHNLAYYCLGIVVMVVFLSMTGTIVSFGDNATSMRHYHHRILYQSIPDTPTKSVDRPITPSYHPRVIGYYFANSSSTSYLGTQVVDPNILRLYRYGASQSSWIESDVTSVATIQQKQAALTNSNDYRYGKPDKFETDDCVAQYEWQTSSQPSCNLLLEQDMTSLFRLKNNEETTTIRWVANGYWRDVWTLATTNMDNNNHDTESAAGNDDKNNKESSFILKTLRYEHDFEERNYDRHRRDAVAMERLTHSKYVMNIYGYCANSGLFEYASGGSIEDILWNNPDPTQKWTARERLIVAHQLASGLAATHNSDLEGVPAIAHVDIKPSQFVLAKEQRLFKLNDFNRCRFIRKSRYSDDNNKQRHQLCPYEVGNNAGTFRSPEEYAYEPQTEKVDVYSLGNIFYSLLTNLWPFYQQIPDKEAQALIKKGKRPPIAPEILNSADPFDQALLHAIRQCWIHDPQNRSSSRQVLRYIASELKRLGVAAGNRTNK